METRAQRDGPAQPEGPPLDAAIAAGRVPGAAWRSLVAVVLVAMTAIGAAGLTDDAWPFAPFRMFAHAVKPDGRVTKVDFVGTTASGEELRLDALAFGLRRAEVEGQQGPGGRLTHEQMADLVATYNAANPSDPLVALEFRRLGKDLVDGEPVSSFTETIQEWPATEGRP
ncbi:hypothetical protein [Dermatobacter hominis]|uniref:hypothetical protein n=1 Tax=Dermatobacter hominis TaxID=2884263 RepID=UPI001D104D2E|nr:hypothetical protein [Dermatobacter hominis]UDY37749.1 hypothetical protein LH044_09455 [Dermatobacter hominis]